VATIFNVDPSGRVQVVSQWILGITPGPGQPADVESVFHPIAEELNTLAAGVSGVTVAGEDEPSLVRAFVFQFTTDMPGGDKLLNGIGGNGENLGRFFLSSGVRQKRRYYCPLYAPDAPPPSKRHRFEVLGSATPRRTAARINAGVSRVEEARAKGKSKAAVRSLAQQEGFKGYSLFFFPSPETKSRYPSLEYLWGIWYELVPFDTMHLFLCDFVPRLWELFAGKNDKLGDEQPWVLSTAVCEAVGREIKVGRKTVPLIQARCLRDISKHSGSYKAVDWLYFLLSVGKVVLADGIPEEYFNMFMLLCRAGRLPSKPSFMMECELQDADQLIKHFCHTFVHARVRRKRGSVWGVPSHHCCRAGRDCQPSFLWASLFVQAVPDGGPPGHSLSSHTVTTLSSSCADYGGVIEELEGARDNFCRGACGGGMGRGDGKACSMRK